MIVRKLCSYQRISFCNAREVLHVGFMTCRARKQRSNRTKREERHRVSVLDQTVYSSPNSLLVSRYEPTDCPFQRSGGWYMCKFTSWARPCGLSVLLRPLPWIAASQSSLKAGKDAPLSRKKVLLRATRDLSKVGRRWDVLRPERYKIAPKVLFFVCIAGTDFGFNFLFFSCS